MEWCGGVGFPKLSYFAHWQPVMLSDSNLGKRPDPGYLPGLMHYAVSSVQILSVP